MPPATYVVHDDVDIAVPPPAPKDTLRRVIEDMRKDSSTARQGDPDLAEILERYAGRLEGLVDAAS